MHCNIKLQLQGSWNKFRFLSLMLWASPLYLFRETKTSLFSQSHPDAQRNIMDPQNSEKDTEVDERKLSAPIQRIRRVSSEGIQMVRNAMRRSSNPEEVQNEERDEFPTGNDEKTVASKKSSKNPFQRVRGISAQGLQNSMRKMSTSGSRFLKSILPVRFLRSLNSLRLN